MRKQWLVVILVLGMAATLAGQTGSSSSGGTTATKTPAKTTPKKPAINLAPFKAAAKPFETTGCNATLWTHVYNPQRLVVVDNCIAVTGSIHHVKKEADGDDHIQLTVDAEFAALLNDQNKLAQANSLILEPICQNAVTQTDAIASCKDIHPTVVVPATGTHVKVVGSYVYDSEKPGHGWMEIHPVTSLDPI
jgi:hypothetical protein